MAISKNPFSLYFPIKLGCLNIYVFIDENLFVENEECISKPHSHHTYEIRYIECGSCTQVINEEPLTVGEDTILLVRPGEYHYQTFGGERFSATQYNLRFRIEALSKSAPPYQQNAYKKFLKILETSRFVKDDKKTVQFLFNNLKCEMMNKQAGYIYNLRLLSTLILTEFIRNTKMPIDSIFPPEDIKYRGLLITKMEQFFSWKYTDDVKIQDLADDIMVSRRQAARILNQIYGMSFSQKLTEVRLQHAAYQLITTDLKIEEISERCGFNNSSYFYMCFRKKYHTTPTDYRKHHPSMTDSLCEDIDTFSACAEGDFFDVE